MDCIRLCRRVRFQSGEGAMIGSEYENLTRICGHCCRITHQPGDFPYVYSSIIPIEDYEVQVVHIMEEGSRSNNFNHQDERRMYHSSNISSFHLLSQPPSPRTPSLHRSEFLRDPIN